MPTFFARRYMRGKPTPTEKRVGLFVLVLLGVLVLIFLLTGGLFKDFVDSRPMLAKARDFFGISEQPLFVADPENLTAPAPPRELRVAESMLPGSLAQGVKGSELRTFSLRSVSPSAEKDAGFVEAMRALKGRWVYARDYRGSGEGYLTAWVADLSEPGAAREACQNRTPDQSRPLAVGRSGWLADRSAGFWSGRYYTEIRAGNSGETSPESLARSLAGVQLLYGGPFNESAQEKAGKPESSPEEGPAGTGAARFAEVPGSELIPPSRIDRYAENLYEKIDGKESAFRSFFVVDLKFGQYADPAAQQTFDAYIYDMAAPVNAMGMYMSERPPSAAALPLGREGYASGTSVFFWKGQYYVNVMGPSDGGDQALASARKIAAAIAETIADDGKPFWADELLPVENRVPNSLSYQATSALGYEFLQRMFFARYEVESKRLQMFLTKTADPEAARSLFARFADATARYDKLLSREPLADGGRFIWEMAIPGRPSKFGAAFHKGPYFGGVHEADEQRLAADSARAFRGRLSANDPGDPEARQAPGQQSVSDPQDESRGQTGSATEEESGEGGESVY